MSKDHQHTNNENHFRNKVAAEQDLIGTKNLIDQFVDAWNKHDAKLFSALFEDDGEWTDVFGNLMEGKKEIERMHAYPFTTVLKDATLTVKSMRAKEIRTGVISVDAVWESTGSKTPEGKPLPTRKVLINAILTRTKSEDCGNGNNICRIKIEHNTEHTALLTLSDRKKIVEGLSNGEK